MRLIQDSIASICLIAAALTILPPCEAQKPGESANESRTLTTADGWDIHITYYEGRGKESPVAILIPGVEGNDKSMTRKVWDGVATTLQKDGYAVVSVDLRKHGDSVPLNEEGQPDSKVVKLLPTPSTPGISQRFHSAGTPKGKTEHS